MTYDKDKVDDMVLALMHLGFDEKSGRAWKGFDWDAMDRLHDKRFISNPKGKGKSVALTEEGQQRAAALFRKYFCEQ
ncbi:MAG: DUF6429 family protein [Mariprofundaceae bacterium]|nr:DUF6429 family protein [Mariprofundaceae bacterium]